VCVPVSSIVVNPKNINGIRQSQISVYTTGVINCYTSQCALSAASPIPAQAPVRKPYILFVSDYIPTTI